MGEWESGRVGERSRILINYLDRERGDIIVFA